MVLRMKSPSCLTTETATASRAGLSTGHTPPAVTRRRSHPPLAVRRRTAIAPLRSETMMGAAVVTCLPVVELGAHGRCLAAGRFHVTREARGRSGEALQFVICNFALYQLCVLLLAIRLQREGFRPLYVRENPYVGTCYRTTTHASPVLRCSVTRWP